MKVYGEFMDATRTGCLYPTTQETVRKFDSIKQAKQAFEQFAAGLDRFSDKRHAEGILFIGTVNPEWMFPCDGYPDYILSIGPRGGMRIERA